ncbi:MULTISPECIES: LuxR family transcriptional regulator [Microbacterium]|uniref:helix-turn-helix transcriptional regulator n=1 Tax=Microbacterium TaxID=33882 RepID=UPI000D65E5E3|nr:MULTISPECIES: LuxR family transcriptional regulator [Microbacterium]
MPSAHFIGRDSELAWLRRLATDARNGTSSVGVLEGEPGVGKTALVATFAKELDGFQVLELSGVEAESDLPFAAVQRLVLAQRVVVAGLPDNHRSTLLVATGLEPGVVADRLAVGLALLNLLAALSDDRPLLVWVDDAHWVDDESLAAFAFVGRRLLADRVVLLFTRRSVEHGGGALAGIDTRVLPGLGAADAVELLRARLDHPVEPAIAGQIAAATHGNPLALIDLGAELSTRQLEGAAILPEPVPLGQHLEAHYLARVRALPQSTQQWLLIAAAESGGDLDLVSEVARRRGLDADALSPAESWGLVTVGDSIRFRNQLVRAAVYGGATAAERRRAHADLSDAAGLHGDEDRRVTHLSATVNGIDQDLAADLEAAAAKVALRAGAAARARLLIRAAQASGPSTRLPRLLSAAEAAASAGAMTQARALLDDIDADRLDPFQHARLAVVAADVEVTRNGSWPARATSYLDAARLLAPHDEARAADYVMQSFASQIIAGARADGVSLREIAEFARTLRVHGGEMGLTPTALSAVATLLLDGPRAAAPLYRRALALALEAASAGASVFTYTLLERLAVYFLDERGRTQMLAAFESLARSLGSLWGLGWIGGSQVTADVDAGRLAEAASRSDEITEVLTLLGYSRDDAIIRVLSAGVRAWRGDAEGLRAESADAVEASLAVGAGFSAQSWRNALAHIACAEGRYRDAWEEVAAEVEGDEPFATVNLDVLEATARGGPADAASRLLADIEQRVALVGTDYGRGLTGLLRAMLATDEAEEHYRSAIAGLARAHTPLVAARAHLLYGEWLRRQRRRAEATQHLETAEAAFMDAGATLWVERTARELRPLTAAAPSTSLQRSESDPLTPQERSVARLAAEGATNSEIAERLFLSPSTVDYHLRKVFRKLDVSSRRHLRAALT